MRWLETRMELEADVSAAFPIHVNLLMEAQDLTAAGPTLQGVSTDPRGQLVNISQWWMGR